MFIKIKNYLYNSDNIIGKGLSSIVYRGINTINNKNVAIKIQQKPSKINLIEHKILKIFDSYENIVQLYDYIETENEYILILELCDLNLDEFIKKEIISNYQIKHIVLQFIKIINLLQKFKIIHHDIKPSNILVCKKDDSIDGIIIKLCDFEMAMNYHDYNNTKLFGSPIYMHPTKLLFNNNFNSDEWSFTIIFYELVYKVNPFKGSKSKEEIVDRIYKNKILYLSENIFTPILKLLFNLRGTINIMNLHNQINKIDIIDEDDYVIIDDVNFDIKR
jgi:serine/threonine protein kinase